MGLIDDMLTRAQPYGSDVGTAFNPEDWEYDPYGNMVRKKRDVFADGAKKPAQPASAFPQQAATTPEGVMFGAQPSVPEAAMFQPSTAPWANAGMLVAPGVSGSGAGAYMRGRTDAPPQVTDPNYAQENTSKAPGPMVPVPRERPPIPRDADGAPLDTDSSAHQPGGAAAGVSASPASVQDARAQAVLDDEQPPERKVPRTGAVSSTQTTGEQPGMFSNILGKIGGFLGDNSSTLLALGAGFAGAPNIGQGISRASAAAIPAAAADTKAQLQRQQMQASLNALLQAKVPSSLAMAAIQNPEVMKRVADEYLFDRKSEIKTIKDSLGNESLVAIDPYTNKQVPITGGSGEGVAQPGGGVSSGIAAVSRLPAQYDPNTNRDEAFMTALKQADPVTASAVQDIADGKGNAAGRNLQRYMPLVQRYEQGFEGNAYQTRAALQKSYFGGGEGFKGVRAANTAIHHGSELDKAIDDLDNFTYFPGELNAARAAIKSRTDPKYQDALKRFNINAEAFARELDFALTGKSTVSGQAHIREMFDPNASPVANKAAMQKALGLLKDRVGEHEDAYRKGMNLNASSTAVPQFLSSHNASELDRLLSEDAGAGRNNAGVIAQQPAKPAAPVAAPKPGRYRFDPQTGGLVPVQ